MKRQDETVLRKCEEERDLYLRMLQNAPEMIYRMRLPDGVYEYVSPASEKVLGFTPDEIYESPLLIKNLIHPQWENYFISEWSRLMKGECSPEYEYQIIDKNGTVRWIYQKNKLSFNEDGTPAAIEGIVFDITERKKAELETQHLVEMIRNIQVGMHLYHLENINDDRTLRMIAANAASEKLTGVAVADVVGRTLDENFPGLREKGIPQAYAEVVRSGMPFEMEDLYYGDSRVIENAFSIKAFPLPDDCVGVSFENITDRKRKEQERLELIAFQESIIANADIWLDVLDKEANVVMWNKAAEKISGYGSNEVIGHGKVWEWLYPDEEYRALIVEKAAEIIRDHSIVEGFETTITCRDGSKRIVSWTSRNLTDNQGNPVGSIALGLDVTDMKAAQEEKERMQQQLVQAQKMEAVGTLTGGLAHDFNNVLGGILGSLSIIELLLKKDDPRNRDKILKYTETALESSNRAADMIRQLLMLTRKEKLTLEPIDISKTLHNVHKICMNSFPKSVDLDFSFTTETIIVNGDQIRLEQVILNLCLNASHAMTIMRKKEEKEGGRLSVRVSEIVSNGAFPRKYPGARGNVRYAAVTVEDAGVGMDSETIKRVFEPFFTTKKKGMGTGLGLSMAYNIVREHKGFLDIQSSVGVGTVVTIFLPMAVERTDTTTVGNIEPDLIRGSGRVLVIDDEDVILQVAVDILQECGYEAIAAHGAREGIDLFRAHHEYLLAVVLDMSMPVLSGLEVYDELHRIDPRVKVIISSGFMHDERVRKALNKGAAGFIPKPYSAAGFSDKLRKILEESGGRTCS